MEAPKRYSDMAPELEQTIYAGDTLVMRDNDGNEFAVSARESEETMAFIKAFDEWFAAKNKGLGPVIVDALWHQTKAKFNALPMRVQRELPSMKNATLLL